MNKELKKNIEAKAVSVSLVLLIIISCFVAVFMFPDSPLNMVVSAANEDFTTYTADNTTDGFGTYTITGSKIKGDYVQSKSKLVVWKDMGVGAITDFSYSFIWNRSGYQGGSLESCFGVSNTKTTYAGTPTGSYEILFFYTINSGNTTHSLFLQDKYNSNSDSRELAGHFTKYMVFSRVGTTATLNVYNDSAHTDLNMTLSITCNNQALRYVLAHQGYGHISAVQWMSGDISNLDLAYISGATATASSPDPADAATGMALQPTCSVVVTSSTGNDLNITFATNESGIWVNQQRNTTVASGGTVSWNFNTASAMSTKYWWRVYCQIGTTNTSYTYSFTTTDTYGVFTISGLTSDSFTTSGVPGSTIWANDTSDGTAGETLSIYTAPGAGYNVSAIYLDFCDFDSIILQENISVEVKNNADGAWNKTTHVVPSSDGNVTLNATLWASDGWFHGTNPFPISAATTILVRVKLNYPTTASAGVTYVNSTAMRVTWKIIG